VCVVLSSVGRGLAASPSSFKEFELVS
jgi:hypothetical protein